MITVDISDWAAVATMLGVGITIIGVLTKQINKTNDRIDRTRSELRGEIDQTRTDLTGRIDQTRTDLTGRIDQTRTDLTGRIDTTRTELKNEIDRTRSELRGEIDRTRSDLGEVRTDLRFLTQRTIDFLAHPPEPHTPAGKAR